MQKRMFLGRVFAVLETKTWPKHWLRNTLQLKFTNENGTQITPSSLHSRAKIFFALNLLQSV